MICKMKFWLVITKLACLGALLIAGAAAHASLVAEEEFNYGTSSNTIGVLNGGTGFAGSWHNDPGMGTLNYIPSGLVFGSLATAAGAVQVGSVSNVASNPYRAEVSRQLNLGAGITGSVFGSYLFSIPYYASGVDSLAVLFGGMNTTNTGQGGSPDNYALEDVSGLYYNGGYKGNVRLAGSAGSAGGASIVTNTTYLALWEADGLTGSGAGAEKLTLWVMTADQFASFKAAGLTSAALNAAATGTASTNVFQRATVAGTYSATFLQNCLMSLFVTVGSSSAPIGMIFDEIRLGTGSLDEVTPVTGQIAAAPKITVPPASTTAVLESTVELTVGATGSPPLAYRWLAGSVGSGVYARLSNGGNVSGVTNFTLIISNATLANTADYVVVVSNSMGVVTSAPPARLIVQNYPTNSVPAWGLGPFIRPLNGINPIITSNTAATFNDPILGQPVLWEYTHTFNPTAVARDGSVYVLYRAEDNSGSGIGSYTSRIGLAESADGLDFTCRPTPVIYPQVDAQENYEWRGGCEDPRVVESGDGTYVILYTQWNGSLARLGVATSTNLIDWVKYGSPFAQSGNASVNATTHSKSAGILARLDGGRLQAARVMGKYWMYWGDGTVYTASSDDLINWQPGPAVLTTRSGMFDASLCEGGPSPVLTDNGIVVFYNGENGSPGDTNLGAYAYSGGQALFDAKEPTKLVARMNHPFFQPEAPYELTGQYGSGTTFIEGLVAFQNQWFLYYGCADTFVGVAVCSQTNFGVTSVWPTNNYYQGFDGFGVGTTNFLDGSLFLSTSLGGAVGVQDAFQKELQLTANGTANVTSAFVLPDIAGGEAVYGFSARWDSEFYYTGTSGCGLSFNLSSLKDSRILSLPVESGYGSGLSVAINNDVSGTPGFFVWLDNRLLASCLFNPDVQWGRANPRRNSFSVDWNCTNGLTLAVNGVTIFTNVATAGFVPAPGQVFSWAARTSTNTEDARIDNVCVLANANLRPISVGPAILASSSTTDNSATNAFDGDGSTQWQMASVSGWIQAACAGGPQRAVAYAIMSANANWQQDPQTWTLLGSNDGTNWATVDAEYLESWENTDSLMRNVPRTFLINQPAAYAWYQLNIATNNGAAATQLAELVLYSAQTAALPVPTITQAGLTQGGLVVRGIGGLPLGTFQVLSATNLALSAGEWTTLSSNSFDRAGYFAVTNPLPGNAPAMFFRLKMP